MQDVLRASCAPRQAGLFRNASGKPRQTQALVVRRSWMRPPAYIVHGTVALFATAVALHLLVEMAALVDPRDPSDLLTVAMGMVAVLVIAAPFAVAFAERAHRAWVAPPPATDADSE